jgi:chloride channel protein, CIC family
LSRRGYHLSREYGVDPLETITVRQVMSQLLPAEMLNESSDGELPEDYAYSDETCRAVAEEMAANGHAMMVVVDRETGRPCGSIGVTELLAGRKRAIQRESERRIAFQTMAD